jgi:hypothetical protein
MLPSRRHLRLHLRRSAKYEAVVPINRTTTLQSPPLCLHLTLSLFLQHPYQMHLLFSGVGVADRVECKRNSGGDSISTSKV